MHREMAARAPGPWSNDGRGIETRENPAPLVSAPSSRSSRLAWGGKRFRINHITYHISQTEAVCNGVRDINVEVWGSSFFATVNLAYIIRSVQETVHE